MLLTIKEVAARLRISVSLAYRLVARGEIPCYEIASCKRVGEEDLIKYLELQKREPTKLPRNVRRHF
ncbi:helix-turn-helix domain-containing protein [Aeoliella sp.]|uniref:helix-turn-helix domain-containing protein n=1 Tax=Aeoliella sp. TaxID=2795800 RepID=UPI003CCBBEFE